MFVISSSCMIVGELTNQGPENGVCLTLTQLAELLFDFCYYCDLSALLSWSELFARKVMAGVPQGAYIARKVRQRETQRRVAKVPLQSGDPDKDTADLFTYYDKRYMELSPLKYNSKLMNSIWGLYNRYSVHNFKKNNDAEIIAFSAGCQQTTVGNPAGAERPSGTVLRGTRSQSPTLIFAEWLPPWEPQNNY